MFEQRDFVAVLKAYAADTGIALVQRSLSIDEKALVRALEVHMNGMPQALFRKNVVQVFLEHALGGGLNASQLRGKVSRLCQRTPDVALRASLEERVGHGMDPNSSPMRHKLIIDPSGTEAAI